ncbi:DUF4232 domain-containing protein [Planosporangium thailandense]|uniref:DUF4232 domain-containing protein n=1 Tax=Planosporangium thailandense TaxID=765197 RepID=A0ABX0XY88_9ACTN|nr:DUF4232 domain-containing protein [Planosporangium thailandense]NJC70224.1 DUF4232 domain-containing protein [Planosporangium thailandense]
MYQDDEMAEVAAPRGRRTGVLAVTAVVVVVLVAAGIWLALRGGGRPGSPADGGTGQANAAPVASASGAGAPGGTTEPGAGTSTAADGGSTAALPRCHTADLDAHLEPSAGGGAAGSIYVDLGLTNHAAHPCAVYGYPGMTLVDSAHKWLPTTLRRDPGEPTRVTLQPGQTAWAVVHYTHIPADDEGSPCAPAAAGLAVTPPDETTQLTVDSKLDDVCQHGQMSTSPLTATRGTH